jgi:hypothetical protein
MSRIAWLPEDEYRRIPRALRLRIITRDLDQMEADLRKNRTSPKQESANSGVNSGCAESGSPLNLEEKANE